MEFAILASLLLASAAQTTPVPLKIECKGSNVTLVTHSASSKWTRSPYHYKISDLITVKFGQEERTLIAQSVDMGAATLNISGEDVVSNVGFTLLVNLSTNEGELKDLTQSSIELKCERK